MKRILSAVCCIALCSTLGLAQKASKKAAEGAAMTDQQFVDFAAQTDMVEANLGQMAASVASAQPVKDYAQMLVTDHTNDFNQLYTVAQQANLDPAERDRRGTEQGDDRSVPEIEGRCV